MSAVLDKNKARYRQIFIIQGMIIVIIALLFLSSSGALSARSFLIGALIAWLPQTFFVYYVFYLRANAPITEKAKILYQGEGIKIGLMILLLILAFINLELSPHRFFAGYLGLILLNNLLPFVLPIVQAKVKH